MTRNAPRGQVPPPYSLPELSDLLDLFEQLDLLDPLDSFDRVALFYRPVPGFSLSCVAAACAACG